METVQLQCGSCNKLMAISTQHLGGQVRCPHCQSVVQAPPRAPAPVAAADATEIMPLPRIEAREVESIFSPTEPTDDLFDAGPQRPLVEMPFDSRPTVPPPPMPPPMPSDGITVDAPTAGFHDSTDVAPHHDGPASDSALPAVSRPRAPVDRGYLSLMLLIFLVPYSIMMTLFVIYLWYQLVNQPNALDMLPDPQPKKDGGRPISRIAHDAPLAASRKIKLGSDVTIGALKVTPEKVTRDGFGDLQLVLQVKNVSSREAFSPMHPDFLRTTQGNKNAPPPYTFVDSKSFTHLYGGHLGFDRGGNGQTIDGDLQPGQEEKVIVTAPHNEALVKKMLESNETLTWRVQLRRGLVPYRGQQVSATAVIGVQFTGSDVH